MIVMPNTSRKGKGCRPACDNSPSFGSSASWVGEKSLKASFYEPGLHLEYVWVDTEPLADVMCQPYVQPTPVNGLAGRMTGYHIALSM